MQTMSELRKRFPFKSASDESYSDSAILDEQEQEEIIRTLRAENNASDRKISGFLNIFVFGFTLLHIIYLFRRTNPLNPFLSHAQPPRIPFDIPFALLHTVVLQGIGGPPPDRAISDRAQLYAITLVAPTYCVLTGQGLTNTAWWSFAFVAAVMEHYLHSLVLQGSRNIFQLVVKKYDARGV